MFCYILFVLKDDWFVLIKTIVIRILIWFGNCNKIEWIVLFDKMNVKTLWTLYWSHRSIYVNSRQKVEHKINVSPDGEQSRASECSYNWMNSLCRMPVCPLFWPFVCIGVDKYCNGVHMNHKQMVSTESKCLFWSIFGYMEW